MQRAQFHFDGNDKVFTLTMNLPNQEVGSTARVYETQSIRADRGEVAQFLAEIVRHSKMSGPSTLYVRAESDQVFVSAVGTLKTGEKSFGVFFFQIRPIGT